MKKRLINALVVLLCIAMLTATSMAVVYFKSALDSTLSQEENFTPAGSTIILPAFDMVYENNSVPAYGPGGGYVDFTIGSNGETLTYDYWALGSEDGSRYDVGDSYIVPNGGATFWAVVAPPSPPPGNSGEAPGIVAGGTGIRAFGPYMYKSDEKLMMTTGEAGELFEYGKPVYYLIIDETGNATTVLNDSDYVDKLKVKAQWSMGGELIEGISVVKKYVDTAAEYDNAPAGAPPWYDCAMHINHLGANKNELPPPDPVTGFPIPDPGYYYFVEIATADKLTTSDSDVSGVLQFDRKRDAKKGIEKIDECRHDIDFTLFYANTWLDADIGTTVEGQADLKWDTKYALKFANDEETELSFGVPEGGNNEGTFTVDVSGQGKILLYYSTDPVEGIEAANPEADMDFLTFMGINGVGVRFNRAGEFMYEMDNGVAAYRIVDGRLVEIPGCYDAKEKAFVIKTNILESYVFADRVLNQPA